MAASLNIQQPQLLFSQVSQAGARSQGMPQQVQGLQLIQTNGGNGLGPQQIVTINGTPQQFFTTTGQPLHLRQAAAPGLNVVRPQLLTTTPAPAPQQQRIIPIQLGGGATRMIQLPSGQPAQQVVFNRLGPGTAGALAATQMGGQVRCHHCIASVVMGSIRCSPIRLVPRQACVLCILQPVGRHREMTAVAAMVSLHICRP